MRALSIRQPYAEPILQEIKTVEHRSRPTRIIDERFYVYRTRQSGDAQGFTALDCDPGDLLTGVIGVIGVMHGHRGRSRGRFTPAR